MTHLYDASKMYLVLLTINYSVDKLESLKGARSCKKKSENTKILKLKLSFNLKS